MSRLREDFAAIVAAGTRAELARGALTIARIGHPGLEVDRWLGALDALAAGARPHVPVGEAPAHAVRALAEHLYERCGFRGNREDYYDPRNSFLNDVLERRAGIPITLAVVLIETAARLGLTVQGVGFPSHFLVRVPDPAGAVILDPFDAGRVVSDAELLERYRATSRETARRVPARALATQTPLGILTRMLRNLVRVYLEREDHAHALDSVELLLVIDSESTEDIRLRGLLYEQLECFSAATDDLRRYLALAPAAPDAESIRAHLAELQYRGPTIH
jgi:regulator of sirC expression with transglutaminase-like and TPR domain